MVSVICIGAVSVAVGELWFAWTCVRIPGADLFSLKPQIEPSDISWDSLPP